MRSLIWSPVILKYFWGRNTIFFPNSSIILSLNLVFYYIWWLVLMLFIGISFKNIASFSYSFPLSLLRPDTVLNLFRFFSFSTFLEKPLCRQLLKSFIWTHYLYYNLWTVVFKNKISDEVKFFFKYFFIWIYWKLKLIKNTIFTFSKIIKINYISSFISSLISLLHF